MAEFKLFPAVHTDKQENLNGWASSSTWSEFWCFPRLIVIVLDAESITSTFKHPCITHVLKHNIQKWSTEIIILFGRCPLCQRFYLKDVCSPHVPPHRYSRFVLKLKDSFVRDWTIFLMSRWVPLRPLLFVTTAPLIGVCQLRMSGSSRKGRFL